MSILRLYGKTILENSLLVFRKFIINLETGGVDGSGTQVMKAEEVFKISKLDRKDHRINDYNIFLSSTAPKILRNCQVCGELLI